MSKLLKRLNDNQNKVTDTNSIMKLQAWNDGVAQDLTNKQITATVANASGFLFDLDLVSNGTEIDLDFKDSQLQKLTPDTYFLEIKVTDKDGDVSVFPTDGYVTFTINKNLHATEGAIVPQITFDTVLADVKKAMDKTVAEYVKTIAKGDKGDKGDTPDITVGGRNLLLDTGRTFTGVGDNSFNGNFNTQGGQYYLAGDKKVSDIYNQYGPTGYLTLSFDWVASGSIISGKLSPQWSALPWYGLSTADGIQPSNTNTSGHFKTTIPLKANGYSTGTATSVVFRHDNLQGNVTISNIKLEAGNVATDWTPAPEDVPSNDSQLVHKTGNETISGDKTFTSPINGQLVTEPENLFFNSEFENDGEGWGIVSGGGTFTVGTDDNGVSGHAVAAVNLTSGYLKFGNTRLYPTTGNINYSISVLMNAGNTKSIYLIVDEFDANKTQIKSTPYGYVNTASWSLKTANFVTQTQTKFVRVVYQLGGQSGQVAYVAAPMWNTGTSSLPYVRGSEMQDIANNASVVHTTTNETVAGDKAFTGNTTLTTTTILAGNYGLRVTSSGFQKTTDGKTWVSANI